MNYEDEIYFNINIIVFDKYYNEIIWKLIYTYRRTWSGNKITQEWLFLVVGGVTR